MEARVMVYRLCVLFAICLSGMALAEDTQTSDENLAELKREMLELRRDMNQMKTKYESEIEALKQEIQELREGAEKEAPAPAEAEKGAAEEEAARLRALAEGLAGVEEKAEEKPPEETVFKFGGLSLQKLNPEISVAGDFVSHYRHQSGTRKRTDAEMRGLELNVQSYLDPFSRLKATTHIHSDGEVHLEEAYFTRFSTFGNANLDLGRFRQQFGVVNRWHEDALDQVQYPLALRNIFGDEGLAQTGASLEWTLPKWGQAYQGLTFQVTNSENERLFSEETLGNPALLFHYKNYRDLSKDTYLEFGLSGLFGWNDEWKVQRGGEIVNAHDTLGTRVFGADLSFLWEPAERALYRNIEWRSELYYLNRDILAPNDSGKDSLDAWGAYSYLQSKVARNWIIGLRGDYYEPDSKNYAAIPGASLAPLAYASSSPYRWQAGPYVTWWQSEWVRFRCEYNYADGQGIEKPEHVVWFQANFAAGPHKHERY